MATPEDDTSQVVYLEDWISLCPFEIQLSPDKMEATLKLPAITHQTKKVLSPVENLELAESFEKRVRLETDKQGIVFGIVPDFSSQLRSWIEDHKAATILFAKGQKPIDGEDSKLEILFQKKPHIKVTSETQNLRDLNFITNIPQGTRLARHTKATPGIAGKTVTNQEIPSKAGVEKPVTIGPYITSIKEDSKIIYLASQDCIFEKISHEAVVVTDVLKISSDIDYHTGNIDACGSVTITGSVMPNFVVKAAGDIVIQGNIESAYVEAKGSLKAAGIFGKTESTIVKAGKSLEANFLQNCHVTAKSDIHIRDSVVNSEVSSETQIDVSGGKGAVVTSRLMAGSHIVASVLGSHGENPLQLIAGVNPKLWQGLERQKRELNFTRRVALRGSYKRRRPDNALERNISVRQSKKRNYASVLERSVARREKNILSDLVLRKELPYVKASQKVYANVHIKIGPYRFKTTEESDGKIFQPDLQHAIIVAT